MPKLKSNPYSYVEPAEALFYGRQEQLERITASLAAPNALSYALIGGRRFGKTSLLLAIERLLWAKFSHPNHDTYCVIPAYINLHDADITNPKDFYSFATGILTAQIADHYADAVAGDWHTSLPTASDQLHHHIFAKKILNLCQIISLNGVPVRVLLLVDEIEEIINNKWTHTLFSHLRWLISDDHQTRNHLKIILAGSSNFYNTVQQRSSPLWNVLSFEYLSAFSKKEVRSLIQEPCDGQVSEAVVGKISEHSGGHPYLTQYFMYHLWRKNVAEIHMKQVNELSARFLHEQWTQLESWRKSIGEDGCRAYSALLSHGGWMEKNAIRQAMGEPRPELVPALTALCYHGWAVHDDKWRYRALGNLVQSWFKEHADPDSVTVSVENHQKGEHHKDKKPSKTDSSFSDVKVFVSYSHADSKFTDDNKTSLLSFVRGLERKGVTFWWDKRLNAGDIWDDEIESQMEKADIALVLVSQAFLNSSYCIKREARSFIKSRKSRGLKIIPVILSACNWSDYDWLEKTMVLPREGKNIESHYQNKGKQKELYLEIFRAIEKACKEHHPR
jgi:hypothetical protein